MGDSLLTSSDLESTSVAEQSCFHCGESLIASATLSLDFEGDTRFFCCPGCLLIAETIIDNGQGHFYKYRTAYSDKPEFDPKALPSTLKESLMLYDQQEVLEEYSQAVSDTHRSITLMIEGISCAACGWLLERHLQQLEGVQEASINLSTHRAHIIWNPELTPLSRLFEACYQIGFPAKPFSQEGETSKRELEQRTSLRRLTVAGIGSMQAMMFSVPLYVGAWKGMAEEFQLWLRFAGLVMTTAVVLFSSMPFFRAAWRSLKNRHLSMDVPVSIAILTAYFASLWSTLNQGPEVYFDSVCMFTFFLLLGRHLEMRARHRANESSQALLNYTPEQAYRVTASGLELVTLKDVNVGDRLLVKPGARVPADGTLLKGQTSLDESILTGESLPIAKSEGDLIIAGSLNTESPIEMRVDQLGQNTQLSTIARLQERSLSTKPRLAQLSDQVAHYFVLAVLLVSASVFLYWHFIAPDQAFWITLSVLVVTCPCALSLATPTALTVATTHLREKGFLVIRGQLLETLSRIQHIALDKTGTLTTGHVRIAHTEWHPKVDSDKEKHQWLALITLIESHSEHPIAKAFTALGESNTTLSSKQLDHSQLDRISNQPGQGIEAFYKGDQIRLGRYDFVAEILTSESENKATTEFQSPHHLYLGTHQLGLIAGFDLEDPIRQETTAFIQSLQSMGFSISVLSGDQQSNVERACQGLGLTDLRGDLSPKAKLNAIEALQMKGKVLMVGDGVNDSPVLAQADASIAVNNATDFAKASADAVLTATQLTGIIDAIQLAKKTQRIIRQNFAWALGYNLLALPLAAMGYIPPWVAAIGMSASSLLVVSNAMRLRAPRNPK